MTIRYQLYSVYFCSVLATSIFIGCSDKNFVSRTSENCKDETCLTDYDYTLDALDATTDILVVVDNSGSMSPEQREMGSKFGSFLSSVAHLDYHLGITTTDVAGSGNGPKPLNLNGQLQNGNLIPFAQGVPYLDGSFTLEQEEDLFSNTIKRNETLVCEQNNHQGPYCPSGDERGLMAASMTLANNPENMIRDSGVLALIFLSDEDERSEGKTKKKFDPIEHPKAFMNTFESRFPNKRLLAYSIVIAPGDSECLNRQRIPGTPEGHYGNTYAELSILTNGIVGDICADDYSPQLESIGRDVALQREMLPCRPIDDKVEVTLTPEPNFAVKITKNLEKKEIQFGQILPKGTKIRFQFQCKTTN